MIGQNSNLGPVKVSNFDNFEILKLRKSCLICTESDSPPAVFDNRGYVIFQAFL